MPRSPLTLAAAVTSALPEAVVVNVATLTEHAGGRFDSAIAVLASGERVVIRVSEHDEGARELHDSAVALHALTDGVRAHLPFAAPTAQGEGTLDGHPFTVFDHLPGYRVDAAQIPADDGVAAELGAAIAAVHSLPVSVVRRAELPSRTAEQVRSEVSRLLDRVSASHRVPVSLLARWSRAVASDPLWLFEPTVTLGGTSPDAFVFDDVEGRPRVRALLEWGGLSVGDPARDLHWMSSAPDAAGHVSAAYAQRLGRTPDDTLHVRARLYAELEFARWLVHGHDSDREDIVDDAAELLRALADSVVDDDLLADDDGGIDEAIALIGQVPAAAGSGTETSMQTDAFDEDDLFADEFRASSSASADQPTEPWEQTDVVEDHPTASAPARPVEPEPRQEPGPAHEQGPQEQGPQGRSPREEGPDAAALEATRASEAALRRWTSSGD